MRRISKIRNRREGALELQREELRDRRWARHRSKILTVAAAIAVVTASGKPEAILRWLIGVIGV